MPPRSVKKAVAKKSSPKVKDATPPASKLSSEPVLGTVEEKTDPKVESPPASGESAIVPEPSVKEEAVEEEADPPAAVQEREVLKSEVEEEVAEEARQDPEVSAERTAFIFPPEVSVEGVENVREETGEGEFDDTKPDGAGNVDGDDDSNGGEDNEENEDDDPSLYMQAPLAESKKMKKAEIFVGGLHKEAVEDDLIKIFSVFGDIQSVRIVKNPSTQKNKGFAFIRYSTTEHACKALAELKEGTEVRGKKAKVSASQDHDTLYVGNICKTWTREKVIETLKDLGVEQIEHMLLPDDPKNEGKTKGFAFLEFSFHSDAVAAFQCLRKPDAVFGCDRSAKVAFTTLKNPGDEALLKVKTVFVEGIPMSWDEEKVKDLCKQYGEIEKVQLPRVSKTKRKDIGFVEFTSRESALSCVEGINNAELGEGETKVKANLAKPQNKGRLAKQIAQGGHLVNKEANQSQKGKNAKSKEVPDKGKTMSNLKNTKGSQPSNSPGKVTEGRGGSQAGQPVKGKKRGGRGVETVSNERPSKKARDNHNPGKMRGRPFNGFGNQRNTYSGKPNYVAHAAHPTTYGHEARDYAGTSGSNRRHSDLEPHGGYLPAANQVQNPYGIQQTRAGAYNSYPSSGYGYAGVPMIPPSYPGYQAYYEAGYAHPSSGGAYAPRGPGYY